MSSTQEGQLALARRAELGAAVVQVALIASVVNVALTLSTANRLTDSIRGAMCAWGVFDANEWGFIALATGTATALVCALWVVLHRLDMRLARPTLTRRKFFALVALLPFLVCDLVAVTRWILELDMQVVASCCSVGLDDALGRSGGGAGGPRVLGGWVALVTAIAALGSSVLVWRRPNRATAIGATTLSLVAAGAALPAILWVVAPHVYETPHHLCPFCLFSADVGGIGWGLFGALFCALVGGASIGLVEAQRAASGEPRVIEAFERVLGRRTSLAWAATLTLGIGPVVRYAWLSGGASLFGGT